MPRVCTICKHEKNEEINKKLLEGDSFRNIAEQFSVTIASLFRHKNHMPQKMLQAQEAMQITKADSLLTQVIDLRDKALAILNKAEQAGDLRTALQGVREAKGCLELLAKLQRELQERTAGEDHREVIIKVFHSGIELPGYGEYMLSRDY